jgi:hypothetical protein
MAPGAKKRKAAKKKKHNHHTASTHENNEHRSQDEKDSDDGEATSPASRDHDVQTRPFDEGSEKVDLSTDQPPVAENESIEETFVNVSKEKLMNDGTGKIDNEMKPKEDVEIKEVIIEYVEPAKELSGNGEISNISSLDYAPQVKEEKFVEKEINSESGTASYVDETKPTEGVTTVTERDNVIVERGSVVAEVKSAVPEEVVEFLESVSVENSVVCDESGSSFKENSEKPLPKNIETLQQAENVLASENNKHKVSRVSDEGVLTMPDASSAITDVELKEIKDKNLPILEENFRVSSTLAESAMTANESTAFTSSEGSSAVTSSGTENIQDSETKPLIAPTPAQQVVRKTSWLYCCGMFDVLTGSSR